MKFNIIECKESDLKELYDGWALTFEGTIIDDDNLEWLVNWLKEHNCEMLRPDFYVIKGRLMNEVYHLTESNAYLDSVNILAIKQSDLSDVNAIAIPRLELGGRWFNDIVDNNASKENSR